MTTYGLMSAMPEENEGLNNLLEGQIEVTQRGGRVYRRGKLWGNDVVVVESRWGKVAAAATATQLICDHGVDAIIFTGLAGAIDEGLNLGDVVVADSLIHHDMNAAPFFERYEIPYLGIKSLQTCKTMSARAADATGRFFADKIVPQADLEAFSIKAPKVVCGQVASGDQFITDPSEIKGRLPEVLCVEMEGAAVAQVCHEYEVPCTIIRTISDAADGSAGTDFARFAKAIAASYTRGILHNFFRG